MTPSGTPTPATPAPPVPAKKPITKPPVPSHPAVVTISETKAPVAAAITAPVPEGAAPFSVQLATATAGAQPALLYSFGTKGTGPGQFDNDIEAVALSPDNRVWVATQGKTFSSSSGRVQVFSSDGKFLFAVAEGKWNEPRGIDFDAATAEAFIVDKGNKSVIVCRLDGTWKREFPDPLFDPRGIAVDSKRNRVFVAEHLDKCIKLFNLSGVFLAVCYKEHFGIGSGRPYGLHITATGELFVAGEIRAVKVWMCVWSALL